TLNALNQSAHAARSIVQTKGNGRIHTLGAIQHSPLYSLNDPLQSLSREEKIALLHEVDKAARAEDKRVKQVNASLTGVYEHVLVA
ncbi:metalloprotease TldD, partial [Escherichia coli]|nr:metalloprotease TldD [Escherichia coli]